MATKNNQGSAALVADPTLETAKLTIDGETYELLYSYAQIAAAERLVNTVDPGAKVNLIYGVIGSFSASVLPGYFLAALKTRQPEMTLSDSMRLIRPDTVLAISNALDEANRLSQPEASRKSPTRA
jgi:hypothetical protein